MSKTNDVLRHHKIEGPMSIKDDIKKRVNKYLYMDGMKLLSKLDDESIRCAFFDPQYGLQGKPIEKNIRSIHSKTYKSKKRHALPQMTDKDINFFIRLYHKKLILGGFLFLWVNTDSLMHRMYPKWLIDNETTNPTKEFPKYAKQLRYYHNLLLSTRVEGLIVWPKETGGLGYLIRNTCEYVVILRKIGIPITYSSKHERTSKRVLYSNKFDWSGEQVWHEKIRNRKMLSHPHTKPLLLQARLIEATTEKDDLVVDAAAGSFSVLKSCELTGRNFLGCDLINKTFVRPIYREGHI